MSCLKTNYSKGAQRTTGSLPFNITNITMMLLSTLCFNISLVVLSNRVKVELNYMMILELNINGEKNAPLNKVVLQQLLLYR